MDTNPSFTRDTVLTAHLGADPWCDPFPRCPPGSQATDLPYSGTPPSTGFKTSALLLGLRELQHGRCARGTRGRRLVR